MVERFEGFAEFSGDTDGVVRRELGEDIESGRETMGRLEEESCFAGFKGGLKLLASFALFYVEEAVEGKRVWRKTGGDEGGGDGRRAGKNGELDLLITASFKKTMAGVGEARSSRVGDDGDFSSVTSSLDEFRDAVLLVVVVQRDEGTRDFEVVEEAK
jgi:hypothetical protein|tara:strand:- start:2368 stop:2841 length:474 start_codon:yes stop_codon:yes gene_type:complete